MREEIKVSIIFLYNDDKKLLLQHRDDNIKILPGFWSSFGGKVEENETPEIAVKRETKEELEYELCNPKLVKTENFTTEEYDVTRYVYIEKYNPEIKLVLHEGQGMGWYNYQEAQTLKTDEHDLKIIKFVENFIKKYDN
jgi:8-oxo-dGTP pyrophosphatase MutT (NUDIX family)